jgi:hypothetical protein
LNADGLCESGHGGLQVFRHEAADDLRACAVDVAAIDYLGLRGVDVVQGVGLRLCEGFEKRGGALVQVDYGRVGILADLAGGGGVAPIPATCPDGNG